MRQSQHADEDFIRIPSHIRSRFILKLGAQAIDYTVMALEGLWWTDDMADFSMENKDSTMKSTSPTPAAPSPRS
ncbi:MAG: hypothetical protein M1548_02970 [Actinobacteria bacterium]|nr:hypothetical protein [Actinomycetota bacterium]